jgi:hypothetical protein
MSEQQWHLSKSVPISIIVGFIMQFAGFVWWTSQLDSRVEINTSEIVRLEVRTDKLEEIVQSQAVTLGRMDENIKSIRVILESMARQK